MAFGGVSFDWDFGDGNTITTSNSIIGHNYAIAGPYTVSLTITNGCGNTGTYTKNITILNYPAPTIYEVGNSLQTSVAASYQWYLNSTLIPNATNISYVPLVSGLYTVQVTALNGCIGTSLPHSVCFVNAGVDMSVCLGGSVQLNASGATSYTWTPAATLSNASISNPLATPTAPESYIVTGTAGTCVAYDTVFVNIVSSLTADAGSNQTICNGNSLMLNGTGGGDYAWSNSSSLSDASLSNPIATPTATTTYTLTVSSGACYDTDQITVTVNDNPTVTVGNDTSVCKGNPVTLSALGNGSYFWSSGSSTSTTTVIPLSTTNYTVTVTNTNLCIATADVNVLVHIPVVPTINFLDDTLFSSNATSYQWYLNSVIIPGANNNYFVPLVNGSYSVVTIDGTECTATSNSYVLTTVGLTQLENNGNTLTIYPNPTNDIINIKGNENTENEIFIYNVNGQVLLSKHFSNKNIEQVDLSALPRGIYFLKISGQDFVKVEKIIKY